MKLKNDWILRSSVLSFVLGAILFMHGFFPLSHSSDARASLDDLPDFIDTVPLNKSVYTRHVSRIVIMVIDALRADFVRANGSMRYTNDLISDGSACHLNVQVDPPTVTMPRIKSMTTGTIPNFIDVVLNLGSSELNIDSLLHQITDAKGKIIFAGDNTWTKMFPDLFERKYENEDSLYVNDFVEGDKNITRVLVDELKQLDWRLMVLHFLGLDHIGHVEGPFSEKVPPKLAQMDAIVSNIHLNMQKWNNIFPEPALLIITGDHGMRDGGGHGGSSYAETNVPLIVVGQKCAESIRESYQQIDIASTLAVLSAVPIPASSIGALIPELLADLSMGQQLYAFHYNGKRLMDKLISAEGLDRIGNTEIHEQFQAAKAQHEAFIQNTDEKLNAVNVAAFKRAKLLYITTAKAMSEQLARSYINYNDFSIAIGLAVLFISLVNILLSHSSPGHSYDIPLKWVGAAAIVGFGGHQILIGGDAHFYSQAIIVGAICALITIIVTLSTQLIHISSIERQFMVASRTCPPLCRFFILGILFHSISYASSSFIEEEHQTWYYLTSTALITLYLTETRSMVQSLSCGKLQMKQSLRHRQFQWISLLAAHLIARRLNQTGDKWLMQPDIGDWLTMGENRLWNSVFVFASLCCLFVNCVDYGNILTNVLTLTACILIYYFRTLGGFVLFAGTQKSDSTSTCLFIFGLNFMEIVTINLVPVIYRCVRSRLQKFDVKLMLGTAIILFALISALTHKPHNILLVGLQICTCRMASDSCRRLFSDQSKSAHIFAQCVAHYWIGKEFFFYQGNSNSLASIDLNAGYIGLQSFDFVSVGILLTINTFSGPILSILLFAYDIYSCRSDAPKQRPMPYRLERGDAAINANGCELKKALQISPILCGFPFAVYTVCALAFRNHIFVWTVFSPKLLYEFYHLCLMVFLWFLLYFIPHVR